MERFSTVSEMLHAWQPARPIYCVYEHVYRQTARDFVAGFPGRVLYAVKANNEPAVIRLLHEGGVKHFDCASLKEVELINSLCPSATCYFMVPVRLRGAAQQAFEKHGVRHFMIDHPRGIPLLAREIDMKKCVVFARMAVHHKAAMQDLSSKYGARPEEIPGLLATLQELGAEPALAFNVGSSVISPDAYRYAIGRAAEVLREVPFKVRLIDIGGGYPRPYPDFHVPPLGDYFDAISEARQALPMAPGGELLAEPGRALAAPGLSAVVEVLLRKSDRLYINDGMYGVFWELRFKEHKRFPVRAFRNGELLGGETKPFTLYGPTCDATDVLTGEVSLPVDITEGDHLEFGNIGSYSLSGRTDFNGFYSEHIVAIDSPDARMPQ